MRFIVLLISTLLMAGAAHAHTFSLAVANNSSSGTGNGIHDNASTAGYPDGTTCFENSGLNDTNVAVLNDTGGRLGLGGRDHLARELVCDQCRRGGGCLHRKRRIPEAQRLLRPDVHHRHGQPGRHLGPHPSITTPPACSGSTATVR